MCEEVQTIMLLVQLSEFPQSREWICSSQEANVGCGQVCALSLPPNHSPASMYIHTGR